MKKRIPIEYYQKAKERLVYFPETGRFKWKFKFNSKIPDNLEAGNVSGGYRAIRIDGKLVKASRIAWYITRGYVPEHEIDHKNRNSMDDRWCNLRHVSRSCNEKNKGLSCANTSGVVGVRWHKTYKKWEGFIKVDRKWIGVGQFKNKAEAVSARWIAEKKYNFPNCNTTSSAKQWLLRNGWIP